MKPKHDSIIEISGHEYRLKYVKGLADKNGDEMWGICKLGDKEIHVEAGLPEPTKHNTLIHEIVHAIMEHAGQRTVDNDEQIANAIAYGLESVKINGKKWMR